MKITRCIPCNSMNDIETIHSIMNNVFGKVVELQDTRKARHIPHVDIYEDEDYLFIDADLPGMKKEDIEINLKDNILTISGDKGSGKNDETRRFYHTERTHGEFSREFKIPLSVDIDKTKAEYNNGVLHIILPKKEEMKTREIPVNMG